MSAGELSLEIADAYYGRLDAVVALRSTDLTSERAHFAVWHYAVSHVLQVLEHDLELAFVKTAAHHAPFGVA